jgi:sialic acid synthase SpsE
VGFLNCKDCGAAIVKIVKIYESSCLQQKNSVYYKYKIPNAKANG